MVAIVKTLIFLAKTKATQIKLIKTRATKIKTITTPAIKISVTKDYTRYNKFPII